MNDFTQRAFAIGDKGQIWSPMLLNLENVFVSYIKLKLAKIMQDDKGILFQICVTKGSFLSLSCCYIHAHVYKYSNK